MITVAGVRAGMNPAPTNLPHGGIDDDPVPTNLPYGGIAGDAAPTVLMVTS